MFDKSIAKLTALPPSPPPPPKKFHCSSQTVVQPHSGAGRKAFHSCHLQVRALREGRALSSCVTSQLEESHSNTITSIPHMSFWPQQPNTLAPFHFQAVAVHTDELRWKRDDVKRWRKIGRVCWKKTPMNIDRALVSDMRVDCFNGQEWGKYSLLIT